MATAAPLTTSGATGEHRFFLVATWLLAILTIGGFAVNLALGRSSFEVPLIFHLHAAIFIGFIGLYVTQVTLITRGNKALHRRLGQIAFVWIPAMVVLAIFLTLEGLRVIGGPPFFGQSEFLAVNIFHILTFAALAFAALSLRHRPDWHKRLMFGAVVLVSMPGVARLLPLPFLIPWVFPFLFAFMALFSIAGMIMDLRVHGRIHPAWWWSLLVPFVGLGAGESLGSTAIFTDWVANHVAGYPGGQRPAGPFLPPGFNM